MNDHDVEGLLRSALSEQAHALVPDGTGARTTLPSELPGGRVRPGRRRHHRIWWATSLVAAVAAAVVGASVAVSSELAASRPAPAASVDVEPSATTTAEPGPSASGPASAGATREAGATAIGRPVVPPGGAGEADAGETMSTPAADAAIFVRARCNSAPADDPPVSRPGEIGLACADAGENLVDVTWSSWAEDGAHGDGNLEWRTCPTDCASGQVVHTAPVTITLSAPVLVDGTRFWTRATISPDPAGSGTRFTLQTTP